MAGLAVGLWGNLNDLRGHWGVERIFEPQWDEARRQQGYRGWKKAVDRAKGWLEG
jgi:glycerol kinase